MKRIKIRINNKKKYGIYSIAGRRQNPSGYGVGSGILPERYMTYFLWVRDVYYDENVPLFRKNGYRKSGTMILRVRSRDTALN